MPTAVLRGEQISSQAHHQLVYLDFEHQLQPVGAMIKGSRGDMREHLMSDHTMPQDFSPQMSLRKLARHLILHATQRLEDL